MGIVVVVVFGCPLATTTAWVVVPLLRHHVAITTTIARPPLTFLFSTTQEEEQEIKAAASDDNDNKKPSAVSQSSLFDTTTTTTTTSKSENGLPWWWELVWELELMKPGEPGTDIIFGDTANVLRTNIEQIYGGYPSLDGCPIAEGVLTNIADGTMFLGLQNYYQKYGSPFKLCFGPKSFLVISDPVQARHLLREAHSNYDKVSMTVHTLSYQCCCALVVDVMVMALSRFCGMLLYIYII
jgi:hypothetical protein